MKKVTVFLILVVLFLAACSPSDAVVQTAIAQTSAVSSLSVVPVSTQPPAAVVPTDLPTPTDPPAATSTLAPTSTPIPTKTPTTQPTATALPEPLVLSGSGDSIADLEWPYGLAIAEITGNSAKRHFSIVTLGDNNDYLDLIANTSDVYNGVSLVNFPDAVLRRFEISATGDWTITVKPAAAAPLADVPGTFEGASTAVISLPSSGCDTATVTGNYDKSHFSIVAFSTDGDYLDLLINTSDPYSGTVLCPLDAAYFQVDASSKNLWTIEFK